MKKKISSILSYFLFASIVFCLSACKGGNNTTSTPPAQSSNGGSTGGTGSTGGSGNIDSIAHLSFTEDNTNSNLIITSFNYWFGDKSQASSNGIVSTNPQYDIQNNIAIASQNVYPAIPSGIFQTESFMVQVSYPFQVGKTYYFTAQVCAKVVTTGNTVCSPLTREITFTPTTPT